MLIGAALTWDDDRCEANNHLGWRGTYLVNRIRGGKRKRRQVRVGAPDAALTPNAGMAAVSELCERLGVIGALDAAVGPVKQRDRGFGAGELLAGIAAAQLAGEDFLAGLDRQRADAAGQQVTPVPGLSSTTAAGLARRITAGQRRPVETGLAAVTERMLELQPAPRAAALAEGPVTIDLDATDVEVYGSKKRGVAYNPLGQRVGRPHVAAWAETEVVLAADLGSGTDDPPARARAGGRVAMRSDAGYFAGQLARAAHEEHIAFAIGARRIAPLWRLLDGISEDGWRDAIVMHGAQVAVADYRPDWWPADTSLLIRRVKLDPSHVSADPRSRRRRTLHPGQRALPIAELEHAARSSPSPPGWSATPGSSPCGSRLVTACSPRFLPGCGHCPPCPDHRPQGPGPGTWNPRTRRGTRGMKAARAKQTTTAKACTSPEDQLGALLAESGQKNGQE